MEARRYNSGKIRYDLIPPEINEILADVFTRGAHKYTLYEDDAGNQIKGADIPLEEAGKYKVIDDGANNWKKGLPVSNYLNSCIRHIESFRKGEDDDELGTQHLGNAIWNLGCAYWTLNTNPKLDDRKKWWMNIPNIWLDIDGLFADFSTAFLNWFDFEDKTPPTDWNDSRFRLNFDKIKSNEEFWMSLPPLLKPDTIKFPFKGYCTHRPDTHVDITKAWLRKHGFPELPVISVSGSKVDALKEVGCEIFIDDGFHNFTDLNNSGITCYLLTRPQNKKYNVGKMRLNHINDIINKF